MPMNKKFLNMEQVKKILDCSEEEVKKLIKNDVLPFYKIAGQVIRFMEKEVLELKEEIQREKKNGVSIGYSEEDYEYTFTEKLVDFLYFNDFYILSILVIFLILAIIFLEVL